MHRLHLFQYRHRRIRAGLIPRVSAVLVFVLFILPAAGIVVDGLDDHVQAADVAVVLGNTVDRNGQPSRRLQARLDTAVALYHQGVIPSVIVSGGLGKEGHDEALVMGQYLVAQGIPAAHVYVDQAGVNTFATARNAKHLMQHHNMHRVVIISQYFHITRTRLAFERVGIHPVYSAHAPYFELRDLYAIPREVVALYAYALRPGE